MTRYARFVYLIIFAIKISPKLEETAWEELTQLASKHQYIFGVLTETIREYVRKHRVQPVVMQLLNDSISENEASRHLLTRQARPVSYIG